MATLERDAARTTENLASALGAAARVVAAVIDGQSLSSALPARHGSAAVQDLVYTTLRAYGRADFFLSRLLDKSLPAALPRALLIVALTRLESRPEAAHTTVHQSVEAAASIARGRYKGLVNGVLRNFVRRRDALVQAAGEDETAVFMHPAWWLARLKADHGDDWPRIAAASNTHPPMALRVNARRIERHRYADLLHDAGIEAAPEGASGLLLVKPVPVAKLPGFAEGLASVQDLGAQLAAPLLDARAGMRVLDACAAPGGKTGHLLELADVDLTALDASGERLERVDDNLRRLGLLARLVAADCRDCATWWDGRPFERVLADVPCSASGVVRRHPDAKWLRRADDIARFAALQAQILEALWPVLAPNGKLLYATCSVFAQENQGSIHAFAARHADCARALIGDARDCRLLPDPKHDGFYYALLEKSA